MQYGVLCLLPPAAMLIFALKTKKSFEALIFGTLVAYLIMYKAAFIEPWCDLLLSEISNADNQYILLLCGLFGGFIFLLREAKGTLGFSNLLSRFCKNERITMMMSVFLVPPLFRPALLRGALVFAILMITPEPDFKSRP